MQLSSRPNAQPAEQPPLGWRERISRALGFGAPEADSTALQPLLKQMVASNNLEAEHVKEALTANPEVAGILNQLSDPGLSSSESFALIEELNEKFGLSREDRSGRCYTASFKLSRDQKLGVKVYPDMGNALIFTLSRPA